MNKKIKENRLFFLIVLGVVTFFVVISLVIKGEYSSVQEVEELPDEIGKFTSKVIINEIQTSNGGTYADQNGNTYDWVELYNGSDKDRNLTGYSLSDDKNKIKWAIPDGTIIKSNSYLIIFLSGTDENGLYANFKLKASGGEYLSLRNTSKKIIDAVETISTKKNQVMARMSDGNFVLSDMATPGYENSKKGYESFTTELEESEEKNLVITEILPNNKGYFKDSYGNYSGYIELTNISDSNLSLKGYNLSNDAGLPYRYALPDIVLGKNESIVIYTSNRNVNTEEYHANFKLNNTDGIVLVTKNNLVEDKVEYKALTNGMAYIKGTNNYYESNMISPGFLNSSDGIKNFQNKNYNRNKGLIINEVMNLNYSYLVQNGDNYYDWIELYNNSNETIKLKDYYLTTTTNNPRMYNLPDVELKSGSYYILMASGDSNLSNNSYKHTNFKLSDNEGVFLYKDKTVVDSLFVADVPVGYSYGRGNSSGLYYFNNPSPGKSNASGTMQISYAPLFSKEAGVYNNEEDFSVEISCSGIAYYTTNGTDPSTRSNVYREPISITSTTVVKAMCYESGKKDSEIVTKTYVVNENHTLPVMSVSLNPSDFSSISKNAWTVDYEKKGYVEYFEEDGNFSIPMGFKLFGGSTRGHAKKSFSVNFRKEYGEGSLAYQVFDNRDNSVYDSLVLRTGSQDEENAIIRDILGTSLVDGKINVDVQAYKSIILYINGNYWGIYYLREKVNEDFISSHYNVDGDKADILRIDGDVTNGSSSEYKKLINYVSSHDLANNEYYEYVASKVDIDSIIDYWVAETYVTNNDIVNCRYFSHPDVDNGKWKFIFYDLDFAFYNYFLNYYNFSTSSSGMTPKGYSTTLLRNLMKNDKFKEKYIERVAYQLKEVWNKERVMEKYDSILNELEPEIDRDFSRWKRTRKNWEYELGRLKTYIEKREAYMKSQTKSYFKLSDAEYKKYFGD